MCPAFGSLRHGMRMRRTATILSGSACCVTSLTFTSHFYGARRTVGYVPFNSETLVTGKLYLKISQQVHQEMANPEQYDVIVITDLCVPTASAGCWCSRCCPAQINNDIRGIGIDVPGITAVTAICRSQGISCRGHAGSTRAKKRSPEKPVMAPREGKRLKTPTVTLLGEMFPADPGIIGQIAGPAPWIWRQARWCQPASGVEYAF